MGFVVIMVVSIILICLTFTVAGINGLKKLDEEELNS